MKFPVVIEGKKYKLSFWKWIAYKNQNQLDRIEKKLDELLNQSSDKCTDKSTEDCKCRADKTG